MKKLMVVTAVAVSLAFSGAAFASSCPKVIKEGRDAAAKMKADDPKVKQATAKLDEMIEQRRLGFVDVADHGSGRSAGGVPGSGGWASDPVQALVRTASATQRMPS